MVQPRGVRSLAADYEPWLPTSATPSPRNQELGRILGLPISTREIYIGRFSSMKTALAISGAGAGLLTEVGQLKAYRAAGLSYDFIIGTSSGGIAAAFYHAGQLDVLEQLCLEIQEHEVFKDAPWEALTKSECLLDNSPLRNTIKKHLDCAALRAAGKSCKVNTTDLATWTIKQFELTQLSDDEILDAILISTSIPVAFPQRNGLVDGGVVDDYPVLDALAEQADQIILLVANTQQPESPKNLKEMIGQFISISIGNQLTSLKRSLELLSAKAQIIIVEPDKPTGISVLGFNDLGDKVQRQAHIDNGYQIAFPVLAGLEKI